eukprot:CAMPEP_0204615868 /NCGR_PEP_ID=MMETSP0717-20131115/3249_1 /ASSEMBLY_ACC=CAM_ASM_000666 /TAXON_ID=230516 /ORGANISM="Chaetoceros curvisetus" /LENGTH=180 /DNA_ID=CAMNT_0051628909 /DNA_START=70 /DNA_END=612 /DNA_ORIENTATION=+
MSFRASLRCLSSSAKKMTSAQRESALRNANEKMKSYYVNRPPVHLIKKKRKFGDGPQDGAHLLQIAAVSSFLCAFLITPFLGRRIAYDEEFRNKYIPKWYDYSIEKPDYAYTRKDLHDQMIQVQNELHERAVNGDFSPEKLEAMRRQFHNKEGSLSEQGKMMGWDQLHPGVDDDEELEDD